LAIPISDACGVGILGLFGWGARCDLRGRSSLLRIGDVGWPGAAGGERSFLGVESWHSVGCGRGMALSVAGACCCAFQRLFARGGLSTQAVFASCARECAACRSWLVWGRGRRVCVVGPRFVAFHCGGVAVFGLGPVFGGCGFGIVVSVGVGIRGLSGVGVVARYFFLCCLWVGAFRALLSRWCVLVWVGIIGSDFKVLRATGRVG